MTFLEKLKEDQPTMDIPSDVVGIGCPYDYGYEERKYCFKRWHPICIGCWNREMPDTEEKNEIVRDFDCELDMAYDRGLNDAWEFVKKLWDMKLIGRDEVFGYSAIGEIIDHYTPQEALTKLKAYEEAQKIEVGDVVKVNERAIVVNAIRLSCVLGLDRLGEWYEVDIDKCTKTGKHLDLASILEQIGE